MFKKRTVTKKPPAESVYDFAPLTDEALASEVRLAAEDLHACMQELQNRGGAVDWPPTGRDFTYGKYWLYPGEKEFDHTKMRFTKVIKL